MSSLPRVALAGATGNLGPAILKSLLAAGFPVTILTRASSTNKIPEHPNQIIKAVDYTSHTSLVDALTGVDVVITTLAITGLEAQKPLVDAAVAAGVTRFLPAEFGADFGLEANAALPAFKDKFEMRQYLEKLVREHPNFSYTYMVTGAFFDWGIQVGWFVNVKEHSATLYNGGDIPFSATSLSTIAQAVVEVIKRLDETRNQSVVVHDGVITQNKIIAAVQKVDGVEWKTEKKATEDIEKWAYEELGKPNGDMPGAIMGLVNTLLFSEGDAHGNNLSGKTWNARLGIKELNDEEMCKAAAEYAQVG